MLFHDNFLFRRLEIVLETDDISAGTGIQVVVDAIEHLGVYTEVFGKSSHVLHCSEYAESTALVQIEQVAECDSVNLEE